MLAVVVFVYTVHFGVVHVSEYVISRKRKITHIVYSKLSVLIIFQMQEVKMSLPKIFRLFGQTMKISPKYVLLIERSSEKF